MQDSLSFTLDLVMAANGSSSLSQLAADVVGVVTKHIPTTGSALTVYDPVSESHKVLCSTGFDDAVTSFLASPGFLCDDVGYRVLVENPAMRAICWREIEGDYEQTVSPVTVFKPAGILGGASVRLSTLDGRYTGDLHIGTTDATLPDVGSMTALRGAVRPLATATDISRRLGQLLNDPSARDEERPAAILNHRGDVFALPGRQIPNVVAEDSSVTARIVAWRNAGAASPATFLHYFDARWWCMRLVPVAAGTLVEAELGDLPHGLTRRGIDVLTLLSLGMHNSAIARRLGIAERTCAHHVEMVMTRLGVSSRTAAASVAIEGGLRALPCV